jgi:hypothetical protein
MIEQFRNFVSKAWKDPVWSKVISVAILALIASAWAAFVGLSFKQVVQLVVDSLCFKLPVYVLLSSVGMYFVGLRVIKAIKRKPQLAPSIWDEQVGHYTFKELTDIMRSQTLPIRTVGMEISGTRPPDDNLIILFLQYVIWLNAGVTPEYPGNTDGGFGFSVLCPKLAAFGLVDVFEVPDEDLPNYRNTNYRMSELGRKFLSLIERVEVQEKTSHLRQLKNEEGHPIGWPSLLSSLLATPIVLAERTAFHARSTAGRA